MTKLIRLIKGDKAKVDASLFQLDELGLPRNFIGKVIEVQKVMFSEIEVDYVCLTKCGWLIPLKYLTKDV